MLDEIIDNKVFLKKEPVREHMTFDVPLTTCYTSELSPVLPDSTR
jgi:hypothetical protein